MDGMPQSPVRRAHAGGIILPGASRRLRSIALACALLLLAQSVLPFGAVICLETCGAWELTTAHASHHCGHDASHDTDREAESGLRTDDPGHSHGGCGGHDHGRHPAQEATQPSSTDPVAPVLHSESSPCTDLEMVDLLAAGWGSKFGIGELRSEEPRSLERDLPLPAASTARALPSPRPGLRCPDAWRSPLIV